MDKSLFLFEADPSSKKLVVVFSGINAKNFMGYKLFKDTSYNKLFIRDNTKSWYSKDIKGLSKNSDDLLLKIKEITKNFKSEDITFIGSSMGGYAALLFGTLLKVKNILAFGPQIIIEKNLPNNPKQNHYIKNKNLTSLINNSSSNITIFIGLNELADIYHIKDIKKKKNINIYKLFSQEHNVMYFLNSINILKNIIINTVENKNLNNKIINNIDIKLDQTILSKAVENFYIKKEYKEALSYFEELLEENKAFNTLWKFKGICHYYLKEYDEAIKSFNTTKQIVYNDEQLHFFLALTYQKQKKYELSIEYFKNTINIAKEIKLKYYIKLIISYRETKMYEEALSLLKTALELDNKNYGTYFQYGMIYERQNLQEEALLNYKKALELNPNNKTIEIKIKELS